MKHFLFLWCLAMSIFSFGQEKTPTTNQQTSTPNLQVEKISKHNKIDKRVRPVRPIVSKESPKEEEEPAEKQ